MNEKNNNPTAIYIALGSNLPFKDKSPSKLLDEAINIIGDKYEIKKISSKYVSPAWPKGSEAPDYINMVIAIKSYETAYQILVFLLELEGRFARIRDKNNKWAARTLDLDIIDYKGENINSIENGLELQIPHPRIEMRDFVLLPLSEIAPFWVHPIIKQSINHLLKDYVSQNGQYSAIKCQSA